MNDNLDALCARIESELPGTLAAHDAFARPRVRDRDDSSACIEVFCVARTQIERFEQVTRTVFEEFWSAEQVPPDIILHLAEDTQTYYREDVELIRRRRSTTEIARQLTDRIVVSQTWRGGIETAGDWTHFADRIRTNLLTMMPAAAGATTLGDSVLGSTPMSGKWTSPSTSLYLAFWRLGPVFSVSLPMQRTRMETDVSFGFDPSMLAPSVQQALSEPISEAA